MMSPKRKQGAEDVDLDLRPPAVLAIGITGHRKIGDDETAQSARAAVTELLRKISRAFDEAIAKEVNHFSNAKPILRIVTMAADGSDLAGAQAARDCGLS